MTAPTGDASPRVLLFTGICAVFMFALMTVFGQFRFDSRAEYHAVFSNVSGLEGGNFVRIAGVEVGSIATGGTERLLEHHVGVEVDHVVNATGYRPQ